MRKKFKFLWLLPAFFWLMLSGCIHEYPYPVKVPSSPNLPENPDPPGNDPTQPSLKANLTVNYNLSWENLLHRIDVSTKTRREDWENPHRIVVELLKEGETVYHSEQYLSPEEFASGTMQHNISVPLAPEGYQVAVWYDLRDDNGNHAFDSEQLQKVTLTDRTTTNATNEQCAFASDFLDLTGYSDENVPVTKELELQHAGARFEIVATDIQEFITSQKEALNQGDSFSVALDFGGDMPGAFNLHSGTYEYEDDMVLSGRMRLPFAEYDELKIAEGFLFCREEGEVTMRLTVRNSALMPVVQTDYFSFPIKRGYITVISGAMLSNPIDGIFSINHIWDGEIIIEI